jgi:hypothetical protein
VTTPPLNARTHAGDKNKRTVALVYSEFFRIGALSFSFLAIRPGVASEQPWEQHSAPSTVFSGPEAATKKVTPQVLLRGIPMWASGSSGDVGGGGGVDSSAVGCGGGVGSGGVGAWDDDDADQSAEDDDAFAREMTARNIVVFGSAHPPRHSRYRNGEAHNAGTGRSSESVVASLASRWGVPHTSGSRDVGGVRSGASSTGAVGGASPPPEIAGDISPITMIHDLDLYDSAIVARWVRTLLFRPAALSIEHFSEAVDAWEATGDVVGLVGSLASSAASWESSEGHAIIALTCFERQCGTLTFDTRVRHGLTTALARLVTSSVKSIYCAALSVSFSMSQLCQLTDDGSGGAVLAATVETCVFPVLLVSLCRSPLINITVNLPGLLFVAPRSTHKTAVILVLNSRCL